MQSGVLPDMLEGTAAFLAKRPPRWPSPLSSATEGESWKTGQQSDALTTDTVSRARHPARPAVAPGPDQA